MSTLVKELISTHGVDIDPHLDREALVPVSAGLQRQGDVIVIPEAMAKNVVSTLMVLFKGGLPEANLVAPAGVPVIRGEAGGNTHLLLADGDVRFATVAGAIVEETFIGLLSVAEGAIGYLAHPEHGYAGIAPGTYVIRRQRELIQNAVRMVAD